MGVTEYELANYWEATSAASNKGEISSTEERFGRICQLAGKDVDIALNKRLASIEHDMLAKSIEFCPHALETLRTLRSKGYQIAVSSNSSASAVGAINASGVGSNVDSICLSFEVGELKPSAEMYKRPLEALGSTPSQSVFVGDGANDELRGAKGVGLTTVCVGGSAAGREAADFTIRDLDELVAVLERLPTLSAGLKREA
jgi:putative hydrolase of the HAD superfamily